MGEHLIQRSRKAEVVIPEDKSVTDLIFEGMDLAKDKVLLTDGPTGRSYTGAQIKGASIKFAKGLTSLGFKKGDCLSLFSPNLPEFLLAVLGCSYMGGIVSPANPLYTAEELTKQLIDSNASVIITIGLFVDKVKEASKNTGIKHILVFGEATEGVTSFASLLQNDGQVEKAVLDVKKDIFALPYSSGTTGISKGVMLTHYNIVANLYQVHDPDYIDYNETDIVLAVLPFFHIYGLVVISLYGLFARSHIVSLPKFDPMEYLKMIQSFKATILMVVPPIVLFLAKHPAVDNFDLSSVRKILCGAAPLGKEMTEAVSSRLKVTDVRQGFGMTELSPVTHVTPSTNPKHGSVGLLIPNTLCKVIDVETKAILGPNADGELCIKGPQVMLGYLNNQQATANTIDEEGWLHTGDIGHYDEEGFFFIVDRLKELIKYKGFQVPPAELEALLNTHPAVADVAVIGIPDEEAGELPKAFVVKKQGVEATEQEIHDFVDKHVAPHKKLRGGVEFVKEIPKSASGKILRRFLRK